MSINAQISQQFDQTIDAATTDVRPMSGQPAQAQQPAPMQVAANIWDGANFITSGGITYNPNPYAKIGGRDVCHGAVGVNRDGAHGLHPIFCPK